GGLDIAKALAAAALCAIALTRGAFLVRAFLFGRSSICCRIANVPFGFVAQLLGTGTWLRLLDSWLLVGPKIRPLAVALFADRKQRGFRIGHDHADYLAVAGERNALHARRVASHRPGIRFAEADGHAGAGGEDHLVPRLGHDHVDHFVAFAQLDCDDAPFLRP